MILVDTSVWVDHSRNGDALLARLLETGQAVVHPFVIAEVALGTLRQREVVIDALENLPRAAVAGYSELMAFIAGQRLFGRGIGLVDAHLLTNARLCPATQLWTRDKRLRAVAEDLGVVMEVR